MAKVKISEFSANPANNTDIDGINIAENCPPSGINDAIRELMAQLKDFQAGTAGDSFNGPVGTTTAAAGAFTTLTASSTATLNTLASSGATLTGGTINGMAIGGTTAAAVSATTLTTSSTVTHNGGTANSVCFLNGSKVLTTGSALTFDGTTFTVPSDIASPGSPIIYSYNGGSAGSVRAGVQFVGTDPSIRSYISGSEQMRLTSTGLGIGTSSPGAKLESSVTSTATPALRLRYNSTSYYLDALMNANGDAVLSVPAINGVTSGQLRLQTNGGYALMDASGNLGLGVTPSAWGGQKAFQTEDASFSGRGNTADLMMNAYFDGSNYRYVRTFFASRYQQQDGNHRWAIAPSGTAGNAISFTQAMTLDASGNLLVGQTATGRVDANSFDLDVSTAALYQNHVTGTASGSFYTRFSLASTQIGSITQNGTTSVAYNTSSDYRLKENIAPMTGALAKVAALKPVTYTWKADGSAGEGFIAHELAEVCPAAVTGEKDAVDAEGKPQYQGIDVSFLVGTLTAAIQEQQAIIEDMKTRLAAAGI